MTDGERTGRGARESAREKERRLLEAVAPILEEGDVIVVSREDGEIEIEAGDDRASRLRETHPTLYGHLASASHRLDSTWGCGPMVVLFLGVLLVDSLGLFDERFEEWSSVVGVFHYFAALILGLGLSNALSGWRSRRRFASLRADVLDEIRVSGLTPEQVVAAIAGDPQLEEIHEALEREVRRM